MIPAPPKFDIHPVAPSAGHRLLFCCKLIFMLVVLFVNAKFLGLYLGDYLSEQDLEPYRKVYLDNQLKLNAALALQTGALGSLDPHILTWTLATSSAPWAARDSATSFVFKDKIWTMGGLKGKRQLGTEDKVLYWQMPHFNDIWSSADGVDWALEKAHAAWAPRRSMSVVYFHDKLWMFGGFSTIDGYDSAVWQSADAVNWTKAVTKAPWAPREGQTAVVFDDKIWMMGGVDYDKREVKNDVWWSDDGVAWHQDTKPVPWSGRWDHAVAVFQGKLFLAGGMDLDKHTFNDVWTSTDGLTWKSDAVPPPWLSRQGHSLLVFKDRLWIIGRLNDQTNGGTNDVWFSDNGADWEKTDADPAWLGREDHSALVFRNRIFVFGGMDSNWHWQNDVWYSSN